MMETREVMTTPRLVPPGQRQARQAARQEIVRQVELGATASEARKRCSVPMHRTTMYRLLKRVEREGEHAFVERRHGHLSNCAGTSSRGCWITARTTRLPQAARSNAW
ncbi:hypothetical protein [Ktedonobacter robiniae]|uniref:hypothetical protein n=1 Tax=Ktedonobacter robiniae TaxID=2778365 RepID=UPI001916AC92|nr:hypothetical protein [Ktedonobacter robiniae]